MSICVHAFLGTNIEDLQARVIQCFRALDFQVQFQPETNLLETPSGSCLYVRLDQTPAQLKRVSPDTPLLVAFEYEVSMREKNATREDGWPPKIARKCTAIVSTRTASGRSRAAYYAQALTLAIMAKESGGHFYVDVDDETITGNEGLAKTIRELYSESELEFDADAHPFEQWPPLSFDDRSFTWPSPIKSVVVEKYLAAMKTPKRKFKVPLSVKITIALIAVLWVAGFL
ncbi:hypothetical protein SAMN05216319_4909 [Duganella sp. CF402]|uniref:hypothetical protein n=1 Tax=unclassified Duganella TaxID=2636909 RepID=UPI0008D7D083|nr:MULTISPECIES: hypothetical protein [unclassified Duganella]RZT05792.1 hypothetical protein EV582_4111 [Duganella sp. BK701]SEM91039.1 hypothetical protein SAMN05216319_4909 [Duganella sp. CF402]